MLAETLTGLVITGCFVGLLDKTARLALGRIAASVAYVSHDMGEMSVRAQIGAVPRHVSYGRDACRKLLPWGCLAEWRTWPLTLAPALSRPSMTPARLHRRRPEPPPGWAWPSTTVAASNPSAESSLKGPVLGGSVTSWCAENFAHTFVPSQPEAEQVPMLGRDRQEFRLDR